MSNQAYNQDARSKLIQIFGYVQAFNQLQNPVQYDIQKQPWSLWFHDLPQHPNIQRSSSVESITSIFTTKPQKDQSDIDDDFILKVRRPKLVDGPEPPTELWQWLQGDWENINGEV